MAGRLERRLFWKKTRLGRNLAHEDPSAHQGFRASRNPAQSWPSQIGPSWVKSKAGAHLTVRAFPQTAARITSPLPPGGAATSPLPVSSNQSEAPVSVRRSTTKTTSASSRVARPIACAVARTSTCRAIFTPPIGNQRCVCLSPPERSRRRGDLGFNPTPWTAPPLTARGRRRQGRGVASA